MKQIFFTIAVCISSLVSNAQVAGVEPISGHNHETEVKPAAVTTETLVLKELEYNFGKIPQGKPVTHIFEVSNIGKTSFKLENVQASCGCTTPQWDKEKVIEAGGTSIITVGYNAAAEGPFNKTITITYNTNQTKVMLIKGEVWRTPAASAPTNTGLNDLKN